MATWTPRTTAPSQGTTPYDWSSPYRLYGGNAQCTWYAYWRVQEGFNMSDPPCWQTGSGSQGQGAFNNANTWFEHYRDPWERKYVNTSYVPVPGDIIVFNGVSGHVAVIESVNSDGTYVLTDVNLSAGNHQWGRVTNYTYPNILTGPNYNTGSVIGCLHYPNSTPPTPPTPTGLDPEIIVACKIAGKKKRMRIIIE